MGSDVYQNHGVHMAGQRRQSVLAFMTNAQGQGRRDHLQSSFRRRLSVVPQSELASELDIYTRRLSDSTYDITGVLEEENIEVWKIIALTVMYYFTSVVSNSIPGGPQLSQLLRCF